MSEEKAVAERPTTDIVGRDQELLTEFIDGGLVGIGNVDEKQITKMFDLYLNGQNYNQISGIMRTPKPIILYLSHKCQWFENRQEYLIGLEHNIRQRIVESKLMSQDFLLKAVQMWHKKLGAKINSFLSSETDTLTAQNLKEYDRYLKTLDLLQKSIAIPVESKPLVGINVGTGATITRTSDNEIEITPKESAKSSMLKHYADLNREKNKK